MARECFDDTLIRQRLAEVFQHKMHLEVPAFGADLFETGLLDSLGFVNLLVALEETFEIKLPLEELDIDQFRTMNGIAELIEMRLPAQTVEVGEPVVRREAV